MRARNLKPGFFLNDALAQCEPLARILFAGLWCMADREGRLEDRPVKIRMAVLPADNCDVDKLLCQLKEHGLIVRYEVDGRKCIFIPTFRKHQKPHVNETPSELPEPEQVAKTQTKVASTCDQGGKHLALNPSSLNPESLILNPPSGGFEKTSFGLANAWAFHSTRKRGRGKAETAEEAEPIFRALIDLGKDPVKMLSEIERVAINGKPGRDPTEYLWQFKNRILGTNGSHQKPEQFSGIKEWLEEEQKNGLR